MDRVAILLPVIVAGPAVACTVLLHGSAMVATLHFVRRERTRGRLGAGFWIDLWIIVAAVMIALTAHLIEIGVWASLLVAIGEFHDWGTAFYLSAMNYTSLGYGDIVMSSAWKILGPIETTAGLLMFGVSTAVIFAVIQRQVQVRFPDLRA